MENLHQAAAALVAEEITLNQFKDWFSVFDRGYRLVDDYAEMPLTRGQWAKVDVADLPLLLNHKWFCVGDGSKAHPFTARAKINGAGVAMSRFILGLTDPKVIADHKDWDNLNNRRDNLRAVDQTASAQYRRGWKRKSNPGGSEYKGVYGKEGRWRAVIKVNKKPVHLGYFKTQEEAAKAYSNAAARYHGDYSVRNETSTS